MSDTTENVIVEKDAISKFADWSKKHPYVAAITVILPFMAAIDVLAGYFYGPGGFLTSSALTSAPLVLSNIYFSSYGKATMSGANALLSAGMAAGLNLVIYSPTDDIKSAAELKAVTAIERGASEALGCEKYLSGFPFPFIGRVEATQFSWQGVSQEYCIPVRLVSRDEKDNRYFTVVTDLRSKNPQVKKFGPPPPTAPVGYENATPLLGAPAP